MTPQGDADKLDYLHNPNWTGTPRTRMDVIDPRACPGCIFAGHKSTPHVNDERCQHFRTAQIAAQIEAGEFQR